MALINCPECGKEVSDKAAACPHCGNPLMVEELMVEEMSAPQPSEESINVATSAPAPEAIYECKQCKSQFNEPFVTCPKCGSLALDEQAVSTPAAASQSAEGKSKLIKIGACVVAAVVVIGLAFSMFGGKSDAPSNAIGTPVSSSKVSSEPIVGRWEGVSVFDYDTKRVTSLPSGASYAEFKKDGTFTMNMNDAKLNGTWKVMRNNDTNFDSVYMLNVGGGTAAGIQDGKLMIKIENYMETFEKVR